MNARTVVIGKKSYHVVLAGKLKVYRQGGYRKKLVKNWITRLRVKNRLKEIEKDKKQP